MEKHHLAIPTAAGRSARETGHLGPLRRRAPRWSRGLFHTGALLLTASLAWGCASTPEGARDRLAPAPAPVLSRVAPVAPTAGSPGQEPTAQENTIRWATASEVDNFGFDVYRAEAEEGPFERINEETIEGGGTTDAPRTYAYVDDTIDPTKDYWYYVESISYSGVREQFTPIGKAKAKVPVGEP